MNIVRSSSHPDNVPWYQRLEETLVLMVLVLLVLVVPDIFLEIFFLLLAVPGGNQKYWSFSQD